MRRLAEAGQQRAGEQERGADALGQVAVDLARRRSTPSAQQRDLVLAVPLDAHAEAAQDVEHRLDVADARHVAHDDLVGREDGRGEDGKGAVLVAGRDDRARTAGRRRR